MYRSDSLSLDAAAAVERAAPPSSEPAAPRVEPAASPPGRRAAGRREQSSSPSASSITGLIESGISLMVAPMTVTMAAMMAPALWILSARHHR